MEDSFSSKQAYSSASKRYRETKQLLRVSLRLLSFFLDSGAAFLILFIIIFFGAAKSSNIADYNYKLSIAIMAGGGGGGGEAIAIAIPYIIPESRGGGGGGASYLLLCSSSLSFSFYFLAFSSFSIDYTSTFFNKHNNSYHLLACY